jgi:hypothetical protein
VRAQEFVFLLLPAADVLWGIGAAAAQRIRGGEGTPWRRALRRWIASGLGLTVGAVAVASIQFAFWLLAFGTLFPPLATSGYMRWAYPEMWGTLFAMRGGLLPWAPVVYLAVIGFALAARRLGTLGVGLVVVAVLQTYINSCAHDWWGEWSFGGRRFCDVTVLFALGLAGLWDGVARFRNARKTLVVMVVLFASWSFVTMEATRRGKIPSSGSFAWGAWEWFERAKAPAWVSRVFRSTGWPFAWPASVPFALYHGTPLRSFEETFGAYVEARSFRLPLTMPQNRRYLIRGFADRPAPRQAGLAVQSSRERPALMLVPLYWRGPLRVQVDGVVPPEGEVAVRWNHETAPAQRTPGGFKLELPASRSRYGVNDLELWLPPGTTLGGVRVDTLPK